MSALPSSPGPVVRLDSASFGYRDRLVVDKVDLEIPRGRVTAIVGPNGCGKSTLLRGVARLLTPRSGTVLLDGHDLASLPARRLATQLGVLPQQPMAPDGVTVVDLVGRGRHPHQRWFRQWSSADQDAVDSAMRATGVESYAETPIDELSGGQRQRVWIALALAQGPDTMLLDEPTSHLDLAHQLDVLALLRDLNQRLGRTIVVVLHDLNHAARYADHLVAMRAGRIVTHGCPEEVITPRVVLDVFGVRARVVPDPVAGTPWVVPHLTQGESAAG